MMKQRKYSAFVIILVFCISLALSGILFAEDKDSEDAVSAKRVLGKEDILTKERLSKKYKTIVIRDFSFESTTIQEVDETKHPDFTEVVNALATSVPDAIASHLKEYGIFSKVVRGAASPDENTLILEGRFTKITTGNRALRAFVGFGAGSSTVGIEGKLKNSKTGEVLATFENNNHSPASMGTYHVVLPADGKNNAKKIAAFIKKLY